MASDLSFQAVAREGPAAGQTLVQDASEGVGVGARVDLVAGQPFRRHVGPSPNYVAGIGNPRFASRPRDPEIDQVGEVVLGDQDVGGLDVTVHQTDPMSVAQRRGDLLVDPYRAFRRQRPLSDDGLQVAAGDESHVDIKTTLDFTEIVDGHHMRVGQAGRRQRLPAKSFLERRIVSQVSRQHLHGNHPLCFGVEGAPHFTHAPTAQQLNQPVPAECRLLHLAPLTCGSAQQTH